MKESFTQSATTVTDSLGNTSIVENQDGWTTETISDNGKVFTAPIALWIIIFLLLGSMFVILSSYEETPFKSTYVGIYDDMLNMPQKALNYLSIREVFEEGQLLANNQFINGTASWNIDGGTSINDNEVVLNTNTPIFLRQTVATINGRNYYVNVSIKDNGTPTTLRYRLYNSSVALSSNEVNLYTNNTSYNNLVGILIATSDGLYFDISRVGSSGIATIDYIFMIDRTSLGISHLTVAQMDYWFNLYQQYTSSNTQVLSFSDNLTIEQKIEVGGSGLNALIDILDVVNSTSKVTQQIMDGIKIFFTSTLQTLDRVGHDIRNIANFDNQVYTEWGYSPFAEANYNIQWWEDFKQSSWLPWNWGK